MLKANEDTLIEHLNYRNSESEINYKTRLVQERIEFDNIEPECDLVINCDTISIETVAELIHNYCFDNLY